VSGSPSRTVTLLIELDGARRRCSAVDAARLAVSALEKEPGGVLLRPSPQAYAIRLALPRGVPVVAVLPDVPQLLRDVAEHGAARAMLRRLGGRGVTAWLRLVVTGVRHLPAAARQDFSGIVPLLIELDRGGVGAGPLHGVALSASLTDLLLAAGHAACLAHVLRFLRRQLGTQAGLETLNLGHLLPRLATWGIAPDFVIGPINSRGFRMKPTPRAVLAAMDGCRAPVLASHVSAGGAVPLESGMAYARAHGAAGVVVLLDDLAGAAPVQT
jgi:hypothetical protein